MAQAFAIIHGKDRVEAYSAGSRPSSKINPKAVLMMKEVGYDLSTHVSKSLDEIPKDDIFDYIITMGCGDVCSFIPTKNRLDWQIPDPRNMQPEEFRKVRDLIEQKVLSILQEIK